MFRKFPLTLIIAIIIAVTAVWMANNWLESKSHKNDNVQASALVPVVVAASNINFASKILAEQVKVVMWPKDNIPSDTFTTPVDVIGKVVQRDFLEGEVNIKPQIKDNLGGSNLSALIANDMRAVSVRVDDVMGVAGFVLPGNKVDIIAVQDDGKTETILKNIKVLAIDQKSTADSEKPSVVRALTVEVLPHQAETLVQAMKRSSLQFTLRNPLDQNIVEDVVPPKKAEIIKQTPQNPEQHVVKSHKITVLNW